MIHSANGKNIFKWIALLLWVGFLVWGALFVFEWIGTYTEEQPSPAYNDAPFDLKLKSKPKDVLYSEAYRTASGTDEVRYAYMAGGVPVGEQEDIGRRTPSSQTEVIDVKQEGDKKTETLKTTFYSEPQFFQDSGKWRQIEYGTTTADAFSMSGAIPYIKRRELAERLFPGETVFGATSTFNPDPHVESSSVDGHTSCTDLSSNVWSTCHDAISGDTSDDSSTTVYINVNWSRGVGDTCPPFGCAPPDTYIIDRGFLLFNTSSLPDSGSITSTTLSLYVTAKISANGDSIELVTSTPASNTSIGVADFDQIGAVQQAAGLSISAITTSSYNSFTLNSTGRGNINLTGVTKFALRIGSDFNNLSPGVEGGDAVQAYSADQTGTSQDPKLDVTYTSGSFSFGQWFPF